MAKWPNLNIIGALVSLGVLYNHTCVSCHECIQQWILSSRWRSVPPWRLRTPVLSDHICLARWVVVKYRFYYIYAYKYVFRDVCICSCIHMYTYMYLCINVFCFVLVVWLASQVERVVKCSPHCQNGLCCIPYMLVVDYNKDFEFF